MSLQDLNNELYKTTWNASEGEHEKSKFNPEVAGASGAKNFREVKNWEEAVEAPDQGRKKAIKIALAIIGFFLLVGGIVVGVVKYRASLFDEARVSVDVSGPTQIDSNYLGEYKIIVKNENRDKLENVEIVLNYSENFQPVSSDQFKTINPTSGKIAVGTIDRESEVEFSVSGKFYAPKDHFVYLNTVVNYKPGTISSSFQIKNQLSVSIVSSPIFLEIEAPKEASSGNKVPYVVRYENKSEKSFSDLRLKMTYPKNYEFKLGTPEPSEGSDFWYIGNLSPGQKGQIIIEGDLYGSQNEGKVVRAELGLIDSGGNFQVYNNEERNTRVVAPPLTVIQSIVGLEGDAVNPGQPLRYEISYQNDGDLGFRDVILAVKFDSSVLDFSRLALESGSYSEADKTIVWKAADVPQLANLQPGKSGVVRFSIPVYEDIWMKSEKDKNFMISTVATMDSPDIPTPVGSNKIISSSKLSVKLNSKVVLGVSGYYNDWTIPNSGPLPPKVGEETTYTIHWQITNVSNSISDVKVISNLPPSVKWKGQIKPEDNSISFNERTNQIVWNVGKLKNGTGVIVPKKEIAFQIGLTPQINQAGDPAQILKATTLTAKDDFTGREIKVEAKEKTTRLIEDEATAGAAGSVVPRE